MKNYKIKISLNIHEGPNARPNKTGIHFINFISISVESYLYNAAIHDFSVRELVLIQQILIDFEVILEICLQDTLKAKFDLKNIFYI